MHRALWVAGRAAGKGNQADIIPAGGVGGKLPGLGPHGLGQRISLIISEMQHLL